MHKIRYIIGAKWSYIEEICDDEFPFFAEIENYDMTESEILNKLCDCFFGNNDEHDIYIHADYSRDDCVFVRDYDAEIIKNLSY